MIPPWHAWNLFVDHPALGPTQKHGIEPIRSSLDNIDSTKQRLKTKSPGQLFLFDMASNFVPGNQARYLRACMVCSIVQTLGVGPQTPREIPPTLPIYDTFVLLSQANLLPWPSALSVKDALIVNHSSTLRITRTLYKNVPRKSLRALLRYRIRLQAGLRSGSG